MQTQITESDKATLQAAKEFYGRKWRECIAVAWHNGNYKGCPVAAELQSIRNNPNVKWNINTVKL